ncbi:MAG: hypothetical protein Q9168_003576 [Polycauliona sp. 1 TL-2023]
MPSSDDQMALPEMQRCILDRDFIRIPQIYRAHRFSATGFMGSEDLLDFTLTHKLVDLNEKACGTAQDCKTVLIEAAEKGYTSVVRILLKHNANVWALDDQHKTAISWAAAGGHTDIVAMILDAHPGNAHVLVNLEDLMGYSPLILAVANLGPRPEHNRSNQYMSMVWTLLMYGANPKFVPTYIREVTYPPGGTAYWAQCMGPFKKILEGYYGGKPKQEVISSLLAGSGGIPGSHDNMSGQEMPGAVSDSIAGETEIAKEEESGEVDANPSPQHEQSSSADSQGAFVAVEHSPIKSTADVEEEEKTTAQESFLPVDHSLVDSAAVSEEAGNEVQGEKPKAPVLYLDLEDEFSAKLGL